MSVTRLAGRYAKSLLDLSVEKKVLEETFADILFCKSLLSSCKDFYLFLKSPVIPSEKKIKIIEVLLSDKVSALTLAFFRIMIQKRRELYLSEIVNDFELQYNLYKNIVPVTITSAAPLSQKNVAAIIQKLSTLQPINHPQISLKTDEKLIGGFVVQFEDKLLDTSISNNIHQLRKILDDKTYINLIISQN